MYSTCKCVDHLAHAFIRRVHIYSMFDMNPVRCTQWYFRVDSGFEQEERQE